MEFSFLDEANMVLSVEENRVRKENKLKKKESCISYLSEPYVFLALHIANANGDKTLQEECLRVLMNSEAVLDIIMNRIDTYYGYYGCEQLNFVYENIDKDEFIVFVWEAVREHLKKFDGKTYDFPRTSDNFLDLSQKAYENRIKGGIYRVVKWAYKDMLVERCREYGMEGINSNHLSDYAMIRKICHYEVDLDHNTNDEIISCFESYWKQNKAADENHKRSMGSKDIDDTIINRLRKGFSFISYSYEIEPHEEQIISNEILRAGFNLLPDVQKEIVSLKYFSGEKLTNAKIGEVIGLSEDQVRYQERKALTTMKQEFVY